MSRTLEGRPDQSTLTILLFSISMNKNIVIFVLIGVILFLSSQRLSYWAGVSDGKKQEHKKAKIMLETAAGRTGEDIMQFYSGDSATPCIQVDPFSIEGRYFFSN